MYSPHSQNLHYELLSFVPAVADEQKTKSKSAGSQYRRSKKIGIYGRGTSPLNTNALISSVLRACLISIFVFFVDRYLPPATTIDKNIYFRLKFDREPNTKLLKSNKLLKSILILIGKKAILNWEK